MRAIILTGQTGQGHISAAKAIHEALQRQHIDARITDTLSFVGKQASELIASAFANITNTTPDLFGFLYKAGDVLSSDKRKSPVYYANALYADKLYTYLRKNSFDAVICPHLFPAEAISFLKRERNLTVPAYYVSTDYTCIPFLEELMMDGIFIPHKDLKTEFLEQGIPESDLICSGIPVSEKYRNTVPKAEARKRTGIPGKLPAFLVMTGGEGSGNAVTLTEKLIEKAEDAIRIIILTGRNGKLKDTLQKKFAGDERVTALGFTENVEIYMDACDVLLSKPGGITSSEAAVKNIALVHTAPIPGVETKNARFFSRHGMSVMASGEDEAAENALRLAGDNEGMARMRNAQRQYINAAAADDICRSIFPSKHP
ncbi:MAG: glycosyl transferase [Candidatus Marinimicrobia bacterium]|nr:glycosyl transferase [Candidatus Neomarinimicrobiota bacterium]